MTADYDVAVRDHIVDLLYVDATLAALIEMHPETDHLLIVNVAVSPQCQGRGYAAPCLHTQKSLPVRSPWRRYGCTPAGNWAGT